jgi:predicted nucleic acid-binding protein
MKPSVYLETTIVSYLVGWLNRNSLLVASNQELTREWWATRRDRYELFASTVVVDEARKGEGKRAAERLDFLRDVELLDVTPEAQFLAAELVRDAKIPAKARMDAVHIAVAAINGMTYLLSWNCAHIVNATTLPRVYEVCRLNGYEPPFVCTPQELMGPEND